MFEQRSFTHLEGGGCQQCSGNRNSERLNYSTEEFIEKSKLIHGDKYNYDLVDYKKSKIKVKILCPEHGVFEQQPVSHLYGRGCKKCAIIKTAKKLTSSTEEFIKRVKLIHGDKYNYDLVDYTNGIVKVKILCPEHGVFEQKPVNHLNGYGCKKCSIKKLKKEEIEFIERAKEIHGDKYNYDLVDYINGKCKIKIICPEHGVFEQRANAHIGKKMQGCQKCVYKNLTKGLDWFLNEAKLLHGDKYNYSLVDVNLCLGDCIKIICPQHGIFTQTANVHINNKHSCLKCYDTIKKEQFIKKSIEVHINKYNYSLVDYVNNKIKVKIICPIHGIFEQSAGVHMRGAGCSSCKESKGEKSIRRVFVKNKIKFISQKTFSDCKNINLLPFDFYLPNINTCIEFNGRQHYEPIDKWGGINQYKNQQKRDKIKMEYCKNNNIPLIIIKYDEDIIERLSEIIKT